MNFFDGIISITGIGFLMLVVFIVAGLGYLLGRVTVKGVSLGTAVVFIVALLIGAMVFTVDGTNLVTENFGTRAELAKLLVTAERQIQPTDAEYGAILKFGVRELRYNEGYELTAAQYISYLMQTYQHMQNVTVANFADRAGIDVTVKPLSIVPDVRSQSDLCIMLTNVADVDVAPIRTVLAKQLQEILPINMIVKADNIIGMANDE